MIVINTQELQYLYRSAQDNGRVLTRLAVEELMVRRAVDNHENGCDACSDLDHCDVYWALRHPIDDARQMTPELKAISV